MIQLVLLVILSMLGGGCAQPRCRSNSDIGGVECVLLTPHYFQNQWATCLTDSYIRRVSNQIHACRGGAAICWYQCQLELNGLESGPVGSNCRCSDDADPPTELSPATAMPTLPPECFSPGGLDCSWYRECLEVCYPCEGTEDGYTTEYALKYCNLYCDNYNDFSPAGRLWVDGVRQCLQLALVPSLRPWVRKTCADIRSDAFNSHSGCYITPALGAPSICDIPCLDTVKAFWIVNAGVDGALLSAPVETGTQMLDVIAGCDFSVDCTRMIRTLIINVRDKGIEITRSITSGISRYISDLFDFEGNRIGSFPYFGSSDMERRRRGVMIRQSSSNDDSITLLLVDLQSLNISNGTLAPTEQPTRRTLEDTIADIGEAVDNGLLSRIPITFNDTEVFYSVSSIGECGDTLCSNSTNVIELATAPPPTGGGVKPSLENGSILLLLFALFLK